MKVFKSEQELVEAFSNKTKNFLSKILNKSISRHFILEEFDSFVGVADLILGTYKPYLSKKNCREPININWVKPLYDLEINDRLDLDSFCEKYSLSERSASYRIKQYTEAGFLAKIDNKTFRVIKEYPVITDHIIAIEAKLKNWKRALFQAQRYKKFSDLTFVLLDDTYKDPALSNIKYFKEGNIGLISMRESKFIVHFLPNHYNQKKHDYSIRVNEAAYNYLSSSM